MNLHLLTTFTHTHTHTLTRYSIDSATEDIPGSPQPVSLHRDVDPPVYFLMAKTLYQLI